MSGHEIIILVLSGVIVFQQLFHMRQIQKLIDKVMSRDFAAYRAASEKPEKVEVRLPAEPPEDLRTLQGIAG
jgi:hypothetical protein